RSFLLPRAASISAGEEAAFTGTRGGAARSLLPGRSGAAGGRTSSSRRGGHPTRGATAAGGHGPSSLRSISAADAGVRRSTRCVHPESRAASSQAARSRGVWSTSRWREMLSLTQRTSLWTQRIEGSPSIRRVRCQNLKAKRRVPIDERALVGSVEDGVRCNGCGTPVLAGAAINSCGRKSSALPSSNSPLCRASTSTGPGGISEADLSGNRRGTSHRPASSTKELLMRLLFIILAGTLAACGAEPAASSPSSQNTSSLRADSDEEGLIFDKDAHPYGTSVVGWSHRRWSWIYRQSAATNPLLDPTGANCNVDQSGPVWFLPSIIPGAPVFRGERTCTIPRRKALLVQTAAFLNDYPCPDPTFQPAPGQSLYDFLRAGAAPFIDSVNLLEVTIDGVRPDQNM